MTVAQISKGDDIFIYKGTIPQEEPVAVVESGTTVDFVAEGQYQLSPGNATISEFTGGVQDAVITLIGTSGEAPKVEPVAGKILLRGGQTFVGSEGSQLTLRAFNTGDGGIVWIEQSRYVAA